GGGSCEDPPPDGIQVERPMDDAGVPARRVNGDLRFLLDYRDSAVVAVREPIRERGPKDPATVDRDVPGFHSPISRKCREFIMSVYLQRKRRAALPSDLEPHGSDGPVERDCGIRDAPLQLPVRAEAHADV